MYFCIILLLINLCYLFFSIIPYWHLYGISDDENAIKYILIFPFFKLKKILFLWSFVIIQLNEVIRRIFYFSSRWLLFYIPTIRICLWASSNDFLVKFWKVTVLQVNWLVSQECSWELSNLLYLYPSKISNLRRGFFFQFAFVQSERGIKHECFKTLC